MRVFSPSLKKLPTFRAFFIIFSFRTVLSTEIPMAAVTLSQVKQFRRSSPRQAAICFRVTTRAIGCPFPNGLPVIRKYRVIRYKLKYIYQDIDIENGVTVVLPIVIMSGTTFWVWNAHQASPQRPKPVCASSAITRPPAARMSLKS